MKFSHQFYRLVRGFCALLAVLVIGIIGYRIIEGWPFIDSLFMTIITISTVGYSEVYPLSATGKIFSVFLILGGVGTAVYILNSFVQYFLEGEFGIRMGRQRMENKIRKMQNHFIVCGFGRVGQEIASTLERDSVSFVIIENNEERVAQAQQKDYLALNDDATKSEVLQRAGIDNARGLIAALGDDAENTYTTLTAHALKPELLIIARASCFEAQARLRQAGAKHAIAPEVIGGKQIARLAVRPATVHFIETVFSTQDESLSVEEIKADDNSPLIGHTLEELEKRFSRIKILAVKEKDGKLTINPDQQTVIEKDFYITAFGPFETLQSIK